MALEQASNLTEVLFSFDPVTGGLRGASQTTVTIIYDTEVTDGSGAAYAIKAVTPNHPTPINAEQAVSLLGKMLAAKANDVSKIAGELDKAQRTLAGLQGAYQRQGKDLAMAELALKRLRAEFDEFKEAAK